MAYNLSSLSQRGRNFARGEPPPRGSFEWAGVGDMADPAPPGSGFEVYEVKFTDLDAAKNWVDAVDQSVRQARRLHGDRILSKEDERDWDAFMAEWRPFYGDMTIPGRFNAMLASNKKLFDDLRSRALALHDKFASKGMSAVPVPYAGELMLLLRQTPRSLTAAEMSSKLWAGVRCGERMLADMVDWVNRIKSGDHRGLTTAIEVARRAALAYGRSRDVPTKYPAGSPAYDEFLRRLTRIWIEAASLAGVKATEASARAQLYQDLGEGASRVPWYALALAAAVGASYLGIAWLAQRRPVEVAYVPVSGGYEDEVPEIAVPDAYREED